MDSKRVFVRTERLVIAEFDLSMAPSVSDLSRDAANRRFMPDEVFESVGDAAEALEALTAAYAGNQGPLVYAILLNGAHVGHVEAVPLEDGRWEIGYHVGERYAGRGIATEAVRAFAPKIMRRLGLHALYGICDAENVASRRVLEKSGFSLEFDGMGRYHGAKARIRRYALHEDSGATPTPAGEMG